MKYDDRKIQMAIIIIVNSETNVNIRTANIT